MEMKSHRNLCECLPHCHKVIGRDLAGIFMYIQQKEFYYLVDMFYLTMQTEMCDTVLPGPDTQCSCIRTPRMIILTTSVFVAHRHVTKLFVFVLLLCVWIMARLKYPAPVTVSKGMFPVPKNEFAVYVQYASL